MQDNRDKNLTCDNSGYRGDGGRFCEMREQPATAAGRLNVDAGANGGATVKGWLRSDVLVRARVEAWGDSDSAASLLGAQIHVDAAGGQVRATGPATSGKAGWSVSYEIFVPQSTDLTLKTHNGGVSVSDVRGRLEFAATNGGVNLKRVGGDISGGTTNGGLNVELPGNSRDIGRVEIQTTNGGVNLSVPASFSAHLKTDTVNGQLQSDFPMPLPQASSSSRRQKTLEMDLGSGGPVIHVSTTNGGVRVKRL